MSIPTLSDLIKDWVAYKHFPVYLSESDAYDGSIYIDSKENRPEDRTPLLAQRGWIADILNTACKVNLRDSHQTIVGTLRPEDPEFFDKLEAHINARIKRVNE
jgi:hypothetical protein